MAEEGANISDSPFSQTETWAGFDQRPYFSYTFERLATEPALMEPSLACSQ